MNNQNGIKAGIGIFYKCLKCGDIIPSVSKESLGCKCGNIFIDKDYGRVSINDEKNFKIIKKKIDIFTKIFSLFKN